MYKVVIVENEKIVRKGLILTIDWQEMDAIIVGEASNGQEGREIILATRPDIVVTDIRMPEMDGLEMIQSLQQENVDTAFIIVSGYSEFEYAQKAIRLGVVDFLIKPIDETELTRCIENIKIRITQTKDQEKLVHRISEMNESPYMLFEKYFQNHNFDSANDITMKTIHYIEANICHELTIHEISTHLQISEGHLSRFFKKNTGYTVLEYITLIKIKKAVELMQNSSLRISEVAFDVGFNDPKYFSQLFRKYVGITPTEFRNRLN